MTNPERQAAHARVCAILAARLAATLPTGDVEALAAATAGGIDGLLQMRNRASAQVIRAACDELMAVLIHVAPALACGTLLGAVEAVVRERARQSMDVVWTGPASTVTSSRLTSSVVVELIDSAHEEILLVSFAAYSSVIRAALDRACDRDVYVTLLLERPGDNPRYSGAADPFPGLKARRLVWPADQRPAGASIHAKIIVIDKRTALVGSANLTGHAMDFNLECGVLITNGTHPSRIHNHLMSLLHMGRLTDS